MNIYLKIILGGLLVATIGLLGVGLIGYAGVLTPYSGAVFIPFSFFHIKLNLLESWQQLGLGYQYFFARFLSVLPLTVFYFVWTLAFIKQPYVICKPTKYLALVLVALSVVFLIANYEEGVIFRGPLYPFVICCLSAILVGCMVILYSHNKRKPSMNTSLGFSVLLFSWLGWIAFPWIGELP